MVMLKMRVMLMVIGNGIGNDTSNNADYLNNIEYFKY